MRDVEWKTLLVAGGIYGGWGAMVATHDALPALATIVLLGIVFTWHGSLQHEVLHGHPFHNRPLNDALGWVPLSLRLPYFAYRHDHLRHHATSDLTDPTADVESFYVTPEQWERAGRVRRGFLVAHHTLLGRLVLGPVCEVVGVLVWHAGRIRRGEYALARWWAAHLIGVAGLLVLALGVLQMPWWQYLLAVYVGHSLTLVRSYCEHRWVDDGRARSAVVEAGPFWRILFLNNNLHLTHHEDPDAAWYRLPGLSHRRGSAATAAQGAGHYSGYGEVFRRYALRPFDSPVHPAPRPVTA